jgi:hypothetical protein
MINNILISAVFYTKINFRVVIFNPKIVIYSLHRHVSTNMNKHRRA